MDKKSQSVRITARGFWEDCPGSALYLYWQRSSSQGKASFLAAFNLEKK